MKPYRENVGAVLMSGELILLCQRIDDPDLWQLPQGGVNAAETHVEAIWREIREELGIKNPSDLMKIRFRGPAICYEFPDFWDNPTIRDFRGQRQTLFVMDYHGSDDDFRLDAHDPPEFSDVVWLQSTAALERISPLKRSVLEATLQAMR